MPAWSYSALNAYETCPKQYHALRVAKSVRQTEGAPLLIGNAAHKSLEMRVKHGTPIPKVLQVTAADGTTVQQATDGWDALVDKIINAPGERITEHQIALTKALTETGWYDKSVWVRGVIDVGVLRETSALLLDYKTGKRKVDNDQLMLFAALAMHVWPKLEKVVTGFIWLKERAIDKANFTRADLPDIWGAFLPRVNRLEAAYQNDKWEPKPSGLCRNHCPVTACEFNGHHGE